MHLLNIHNKGKKIYLFCRTDQGKQVIIEDNDFYPFYYEPDANGTYLSYDNKQLRKVICSVPGDIAKQRSNDSYESDIAYPKRYIIDKIDVIEKVAIKYFFIDIETLSSELPDATVAPDPISCISVYNSFSKDIKTFYLGDYSGNETQLHEDFITYIHNEKPDVLCLDENTEIRTKRGLKLLKDIRIGDKVLSMNQFNNCVETKVIDINEKKDVAFKIKTRTDSIIASYEHPFLVANFKNLVYKHNGFKNLKKAEELSDKDYLLSPINYLEGYQKEDDYFWFVGYYLGDGTKGIQKRLEVKDDNLGMIQIVQKVLQSYNVQSTIKKYGNCYILYSKNSLIASNLKDSINNIYQSLEKFLYGLNTSQQIDVVSGLIDADGCFCNNHLHFDNVNEIIIRWMSYVLWGIGIPNKVITMESFENEQKSFSISIYSSKNRGKLRLKHPNKIPFFNIKHNRNDTIPITKLLSHIIISWKISIGQKLHDKLYSSNKTITREFTEQILLKISQTNLSKYQSKKMTELLKFVNSYFFNPVLKISKIKDEIKLIDITLEKYHLFVGNNILTHNCGWNMDHFYYPYLQKRIENFAKRISPIGQARYGKDGLFYPAGISVIDYMLLFKKVYTREQSYKLDHIAEKYLGQGKKYKEIDFSVLSPELKARNKEDVELLVDIEEETKLIPYYNEIRILTWCLWEDLYYNSRIVDMLLLKEAKNSNVILPQNKKGDKGSFKGAIRDALEKGCHYNCGKYDLGSCYPAMIINFNLDKITINSQEGIEVDGVKFNQDIPALYPIIVKKILLLKNKLKKDKKTKPELQKKYDAIKGIVNSFFGVLKEYCRLSDKILPHTITYLVRDLLDFCMKKVENEGYKIIYYDTDGLIINTDKNLTVLLNDAIQEWGKLYGKDYLDLEFEYEGIYTKLFIKATCHYYGYILGEKAPEIKGIEVKRASSSKYEASYQEKLINFLLDKKPKEHIVTWIKSEKERLKTLPLQEIAFPCKIQSKEYVNIPIFVRAYNNTRLLLPKFKVEKGELFYYIFVNSLGKDSNGKDINVLAFNDSNINAIEVYKDKIDWGEIYRRSIMKKSDTIFNAMGWNLTIELSNQLTLF